MSFWDSHDPTREYSNVVKYYLPLPINNSFPPVLLRNGNVGVHYKRMIPGLYRKSSRKAVRNNEIMPTHLPNNHSTMHNWMPRSRRRNRKTRRRRNRKTRRRRN
jgi:hypothetical protein